MSTKITKILDCEDQDLDCGFMLTVPNSGAIYIDKNGKVTGAYDRSITTTSKLKKALEKHKDLPFSTSFISGSKTSIVVVGVVGDGEESGIKVFFEDGTVEEDEVKAFVKAFNGILFNIKESV
jgi:hypothetical protein